ncbi:hypothetical protein HaLaN_03587 [Haematococcus lacustris]|uniref:Uncharacterized protein n=1 Tax=Haematococcus lacustris TaxID=44745 RepID=A0A699YGQ0_HAELA|nr:hypothetical protein HaLaN_03587 [Haematococcus lacustris]
MVAKEAQVEALALAKGVRLPADMLELAAKYGLRASALAAYFTAQDDGSC